MAIPEFKLKEIVWAKIKGFPHWPATVEKIYGKTNQMAEIFWLNDYRRSKILKTQMFKFVKNFDMYAKDYDKYIGLETAVKEAMILLMNPNYKK